MCTYVCSHIHTYETVFVYQMAWTLSSGTLTIFVVAISNICFLFTTTSLNFSKLYTPYCLQGFQVEKAANIRYPMELKGLLQKIVSWKGFLFRPLTKTIFVGLFGVGLEYLQECNEVGNSLMERSFVPRRFAEWVFGVRQMVARGFGFFFFEAAMFWRERCGNILHERVWVYQVATPFRCDI